VLASLKHSLIPSSGKKTKSSKNLTHARGVASEYIPFIVTDNETRRKIEDLKVASLPSNEELPILVTAHIDTFPRAPPLTTREREHIMNLTDNKTEKMPMALVLYPGAFMLINNNVNTGAGLGQGSRCHVIHCLFPPNVVFVEGVYRGSRVRMPMRSASSHERVQPTGVVVEMLDDLIALPVGQPADLPPNVIVLPFYTLKSTIMLDRLLGNPRGSVSTRIRQLPIRPANALTTYACIGCEFERYIIAQTNAKEFYTQISRGSSGLKSISLSVNLKKKFAPAPHPDVPVEVARLTELHKHTKSTFV
jgi:hypothetical protein